MKKKIVFLPRAGTLIRRVADSLLLRKGKAQWWSPGSTKEARCCRTLRARHGWPIEDRAAKGEKYFEYRIDPERRSHFQFGG
jgi:hypothetical protein